MKEKNIKLCLYKSIYEAYVHKDEQVECSFEELVEFFIDEQKLLVDKTEGLLFNCLDYNTNYLSPTSVRIIDANPDDYIRRCKENVNKIYCLLLDVDGTMTLDDAIKQWCDYEFLIYSTHSNSVEKEKFRLVIPLAIPLTNEEFDKRHESMIEEFHVDGASFTISQCFYLPSYNINNKDISYVHWNKSDTRYDATILKTIDNSYRIQTEKPDITKKTPISLAVYNTLLTGRDLHYSDSLALAILCKSKGIDASQYKHIVYTISHPESDLRTKKVDLDKLYKQGYESFMTDQKAIKLMEKLNCDMWRFKLAKFR